MEIPDYRRNALQYYDMFRELAKTCWTEFIDDYAQGMFLVHEGIESDRLIFYKR